MGNDIPMGFACWHDRGDLVGLLFGLLQVPDECLNGDRIPPVLRRSMKIQSGEFSVPSLSPFDSCQAPGFGGEETGFGERWLG